jgi:hypothetical protein
MKKLILKIDRKIGRPLGLVGIGRYLAGVTLAAAMVCSVASAQVGAAALSGVVQDQTGAVIPSASITLQNAASGQQRMVKTNGAGSFSFAAVPSGDYSLTVTKSGFEQSVNSGIHLNAGDALALPPLKLQIGSESRTVEVSETNQGLPLDSGQLSATITANDLDRLSVVGRDATELQRILPGFAIRSLGSTNTAPDFSQVTIGQPTPYASNGAPVAGITLKLDGANLTDAGSLGSNLQNINDSFVSEVQVQTSNFGADQSNGPVIITGVTKSGTQTYHGSLYTFARIDQLNSNDALAKNDGIPRPNDRFVYPGGTISGPIPHSKKLTFFAGAEFDAQKNVYAYGSSSSAIVQALVPTAAMRKGDFSTASLQNYLGPNYPNQGTYYQIGQTPTVGDNGNTLNNGNISAFLDPGALALVNGTLPLPTMPTNAAGFNYQTENLVNNNIAQFGGRVDYTISPKNLLFARYSFEKGSQGQPQIPYYSPTASSVLGAVNTPGGGLLNNISVHSGAANYVTVFTPTLTNEFYATLTYFSQNFVPKNESALLKSSIGYPYNGIFDNGSSQYPQLSTYAEYGGLPLGLWPDFSLGPLYLKKFQPSVGDNLTKVWGTHTVKVGVFGERVTNNQSITNGASNGAIQNYYFGSAGSAFHSYAGKYPNGTPAFDPTTHFNSGNTLANFFEGQIQDFHQQSFLPKTDVYFWNVDAYAQDAWRIKPNIVVTYGLRISHLGAWTDSHGLGAAVFNPSLIGTTLDTATNPFPGFQWHGLTNSIQNSGTGSTAAFFEPRAGFAWDVFKTGKTVVRGGIGVYRFHDAETDVNGAFQTASGLRNADLQGFGGNTLAGVDTVHQDPATYGNAGGTQTSLPITSVTGLNASDHTAPVTNNYSLSISQQLPKGSIIQFSYVGNNSNSLLNNGTTQAVVLNNVNAVPVGYLFTPAAATLINKAAPGACDPTGCTPLQAQTLSNLQNYPGEPSVQAARPYPEYGSIIVPQHNTYANYNGLQVVFIKQTGHLTYNVNYSFSKALGILGSAADFNFTAPIDPFSIQANYGPMNFDRTQVVNFSYSYQFGKLVQERLLGAFANNWLISGITTIQSGGDMQTGVSFSPNFYLQGTIGNGANALSVNNQAILGTPDVSLQPTLKCNPRQGLGKNQYINGACFGVPAIGTNGQNIFPYTHGPAFFNSDLTLEKGFSVGGERRVRFRYAAFNFLNHPLHSFGTGFASQTTLNLSDTSNGGTAATAAYSPASGFGFAPLTIGRRLSEVSLKFDF